MPTAACPNAVRASFHRVFTSKLAHGVANKIKWRSKRERRRAGLAAFGAQARRTSPASSLAAPVPCSPASSRAQIRLNVMPLPTRCADERSDADIALGRLLLARCNRQLGCSYGRQALAGAQLQLQRQCQDNMNYHYAHAVQQSSMSTDRSARTMRVLAISCIFVAY